MFHRGDVRQGLEEAAAEDSRRADHVHPGAEVRRGTASRPVRLVCYSGGVSRGSLARVCLISPPPVAVRLPERKHELEDAAGKGRNVRRAHGGLRGPRPAPAVGSVSRRPGEDADEEVVLLAIDDTRKGHARADLPEPRRGAAPPVHARAL